MLHVVQLTSNCHFNGIPKFAEGVVVRETTEICAPIAQRDISQS